MQGQAYDSISFLFTTLGVTQTEYSNCYERFFELFLCYWTVLNNLNDDSVVHVSSKGLTPITLTRSNAWYPQKSTRRCSERCQKALGFHRITGELKQPFWDKLG